MTVTRIGETRFDRLSERKQTLYFTAHTRTRPLNQAYVERAYRSGIRASTESKRCRVTLRTPLFRSLPLPPSNSTEQGERVRRVGSPLLLRLPSPLVHLRDVASVPRMFPGVRKEVDSINVAKRFQDIALHGCVNNGDLSKGFELSKAVPGRHLPRRDEAAQQLSKIPHPTCLNIERHIPNHPGATRGWCFSPRAAEETLDGRGRGAERKDKG